MQHDAGREKADADQDQWDRSETCEGQVAALLDAHLPRCLNPSALAAAALAAGFLGTRDVAVICFFSAEDVGPLGAVVGSLIGGPRILGLPRRSAVADP